jgi:MATE family multidrug resistance protein
VIRRLFPPDRTRELALLAGPIILGMLSQIVLNLVDTAMVGRLGPAPQGAAGLGSFAFFVLANLIIGIGTGVQATVSRRDGEGRKEGAGAALDTGLVIAFALGLPLGYGLSQLAPAIFPLLSDDPEVVTGGTSYLAIRLMGVGAVAANYCFRGFYNGIGQSVVYMTTIAVIQATNIVLNWVFIYGNLGAAPMGVRGAALASVLAAVMGVVIYSALTLVRAEVRQTYRPLRFANVRLDLVRAMARLTWPEAVRGILLMLGYTLFLKLHALIDTRAVAAGTILVNISSAGFLPALGMGLACSTMVGRHLGRGEPDEGRKFGYLGVRIGTAALAPVALFLALFPDPMLGLFTRDALVIEAARPALRLFAVSMVLDATPMVLVFSLLGAGATRWVAGIQVVQQYVLLLPLAWLLGVQLELGVLGLWLGMLGSRVGVAVAAWRKFAGDSWTRIEV